MRLRASQKAILLAISRGEMLRSHRDMDGNKEFRLHQNSSQWRPVSANDVAQLRSAGLIDSNKKFPVATFWLTRAGHDFVDQEG